jgi:DNA-3-methyladenine glycosylase I
LHDIHNEDPPLVRCAWVGSDPVYIAYHDEEWGVPCHDDRALFERLLLEGFQAGLSWITILRKRQNFITAFDGFDAERIAEYGPEDIECLMSDPGIIRNRLKIASAVTNAQAFLAVQSEFGSFDAYIWTFAPQSTSRPQALSDVPSSTPESDAMSKDLKRRGFRFVGTTICYAFMQSAGIVDDHTQDCFRAIAPP